MRPAADRKTGFVRGLAAAAVMHTLLVGALYWSTRWKSAPPLAVEAELWSAAPAPSTAPPPAPPPPPPSPAPAPPGPVLPKVDIALEKAKLEKEKIAREKAELERQDKARLAREQTAIKQKTERDAKLKLQAQREAELREQIEKDRSTRLARLTQGTSPNGAATASKGLSDEYARRIEAQIKPRIRYDGDRSGSKTIIRIRLSPNGDILSRQVISRSNRAEWDEAVLRAIEATAKLPKDRDGQIPESMELSFSPRERE